MPRFYLIDPWLADAKGHNYQYALDVAGAAQQRGYKPILAVRDDLAPNLRFPAKWQVNKLFKYGECPRHWIGLDGRNPHPCDLEGVWLPDSGSRWWERLIDLPSQRDRRRRIVSFVQGCAQLFTNDRPRAGDILFLPSLSEFDFLCAVRFWRDHAWTRDVDWHLQFHFNFFNGRDTEYSEQLPMLHRFQRLFRSAVDQIPEHRIHFYATSQALARQYNALGIAIFHPLPYPVRPLLDDPVVPAKVARRPLKVTRPGAMRREKGKKQLSALIDSTWEEFLQPGQIQFVFQASPTQIEHWLPRRLRGVVRVPPAGSLDPRSPLLAASHPLDAEKYTELICGSDVGLLMYDARRYYSRVSGVMCEMLSAGVPVIVPAGCWLADQIAEENYRHVELLWQRHETEGNPIEMSAAANMVVPLPTASQVLLLKFDSPANPEPGTFLELTVRNVSDPRESISVRQREVLGLRDRGQIGAVIRFPNPVAQVQITLRDAFQDRAWHVPALKVLPLPPASVDGFPPLGRVGLIAADDSEIPRLLGEMTAHYDHYQATAREFAGHWQTQHSPTRTIAELESRIASAGDLRQTHAA